MPTKCSLAEMMREATCPACAHHVAVSCFDGGRQPLTTLAWPSSRQAAQAMSRLPLDFVCCVSCGHVYNCQFDYTQVPYSDKPNLMFNRGQVWKEHLQRIVDLLLERLPDEPVVVEIGCGDGHLLAALAQSRPGGRYVGFDPHATVSDESLALAGLEVHHALFLPDEHLEVYRPHLIVSRHVLEHLTNPLGFLQSLTFAVSCTGEPTRLFIEVPCIDRVFETNRTSDFFYEHNSHFTTRSFERLLDRCTSKVERIERGYNDEVIYGLARFEPQSEQVAMARRAADFAARTTRANDTLRAALDELGHSGRTIAIWGGTGKAAAFINQYGLDAARFPLVVDSDAAKVGTFVPGTGQEIRPSAELLQTPVDAILIATQWRARDIALEMQHLGIRADSVLLAHRERLIDYFRDTHPYGTLAQTLAAHSPVQSPVQPIPVWPNAMHTSGLGTPPFAGGTSGW